ncbi:MAG: response regulator [Phaeodactylibacter sp.]|nr:response regulator [Phaeodactylibacter sp.]
MQSLSILIIEDDYLAAADLEEELAGFGYRVAAVTTDSESALRAFRENLPDIALVDIELKGSPMDGIELAQAFNSIKRIPIVFLTGHYEPAYLERAKLVGPASYLLKPHTPPQLDVTLSLALSNFFSRKMPDIHAPLAAASPPACIFYSETDFFFVKQDYRHLRVEVRDIRWVQALRGYVRIVTGTDSAIFSVKLNSFMEQVPDPALMQVHRSYVVNCRHVVSYTKGQAFVRRQDGVEEIPIGKKYREAFFQALPRLRAD